MNEAHSAMLAVWAQPGASRERLVGMAGDALKVAVTAPPEKGKANKAVERLLAKALGLPPSAVRVVRGETSRRKTVRCEGIAPETLNERLKTRLGDARTRERNRANEGEHEHA